jgi:hypothetical protein
MKMDFSVTVQAKVGNKDAFRKLWKTYQNELMRFAPNESEAALMLVRKIETFNPKKFIQD